MGFAKSKIRADSRIEIKRVLAGVGFGSDAMLDFRNRLIMGIGILIKLGFEGLMPYI